MAKINNKKKYKVTPVTAEDLLLGTQLATGKTVNFQVEDLAEIVQERLDESSIENIEFRGEDLEVIDNKVVLPHKLSEFENDLDPSGGGEVKVDNKTISLNENGEVTLGKDGIVLFEEEGNTEVLELRPDFLWIKAPNNKSVSMCNQQGFTMKQSERGETSWRDGHIVYRDEERGTYRQIDLPHFDTSLNVQRTPVMSVDGVFADKLGDVVTGGGKESVKNIGTIEDLKKEVGKTGDIVRLLGYYEVGDKPELLYKWVEGVGVDDGGSVIVSEGGYWEALFNKVENSYDYGIKEGQDISFFLNSRNKMIPKTIKEGSYILNNIVNIHSNTHIVGEGEVVIYAKNNISTMFRTIKKTPKIISKTTSLESGSLYYEVENELKEGDFINFRSNQRFTRLFDNGTPLRDYWVDAEMMEVRSSENNRINFTSRNFLNFELEDITDITYFEPYKNIIIENIALIQDKNKSYSTCVHIQQCNGFLLKNIKTYYSDYAGVNVENSMNGEVVNIKGEGGSSERQLNYLVLINNGSKYINIENIQGVGFRHVFSAGGDGYSIPMFCDVTKVICKDGDSHGVDTHGNTANFNFSDIITSRGVMLSGIGHNIENVISYYNSLHICQGGYNITFRNIKLYNSDGLWNVESQNNTLPSIVKCTFEELYVELKPTSQKNNFWRSSVGDNSNTYNNIRIINTKFKLTNTSATNEQELKGRVTNTITFRNNDSGRNILIEGFKSGIMLNGDNIKIQNITFKNTGWSDGTSSLSYLIAMTRGKGISIEDVFLDIDSSVDTSNTQVIRANVNDQNTTRVVVNRVVQKDKKKYSQNIYMTSSCRYFTISEMEIEESTTNTINNDAKNSLLLTRCSFIEDIIPIQ